MRIWKFAVERWQFTLVVFALLIALGAYAVQRHPATGGSDRSRSR